MRTTDRPARQDKQRTRSRLLEAGRSLLLEQGVSEHVDVKMSDACEASGYTTGAAYKIWPTQRDYQRDLALHLASNFDWAGPQTIQDELYEIIASTNDYVELTRAACIAYLDAFVSEDDFYLALQFWSVQNPSTELAAALVQGYETVHCGFVDLFDGLMQIYRRRPKGQTTKSQLTTMATAVTEGLALRHRVEPERVTTRFIGPDGTETTLFAEAMIAIINHMTEPDPTHQTSKE